MVLMFKEIDVRFSLIQHTLSKTSSTKLIEKAYDLAKYLHKDQRRKDGKPYLSHPVEVALILCDLGFDENVISAALLHDVVEDCEYELSNIEKNFNRKIAEMVDCVSAIDKEKFVFDKEDLYESEQFEKASIEEQSFKKLIAIGRKNPLGFCIKFADRLHNLRTIETFDYNKQLEKVKETEKWIIPIAKILNAEYFYRSLKNECFKIIHKYDGIEFFEHYKSYHQSNADNVKRLIVKFQEIFAHTNIREIKVKDVREYKVFEDLSLLLRKINVSKVSQGQILKVTNYNIYLLYEKEKYKDIIGVILATLDKKLGDEIKVINARIGSFTNKPVFQLEDKYKNKYNLYIMNMSDYVIQRNGTLDGQAEDLIENYNLDNLEVDLIKVKTRSGEIKYIPRGSTTLDFAFKIHRDIGFGYKYAVVNNSKTKAPPYTKLYDGDMVEIVVDKNDKGEIVNNAEIKWLAYVNTDNAKRILIKEFEKRYY